MKAGSNMLNILFFLLAALFFFISIFPADFTTWFSLGGFCLALGFCIDGLLGMAGGSRRA